MKEIFTLHLIATCMLTGLIWTIQLVHYPLFAQVGEAAFTEYERLHRAYIGPYVGPLMVFELGTAFFLLGWRPNGIPPWLMWVGLALVGIIWLNTFFQAVPLHAKLDQGLNTDVVRQLVNVNWIRTIAWTLRALIMAYILYKLLPG